MWLGWMRSQESRVPQAAHGLNRGQVSRLLVEVEHADADVLLTHVAFARQGRGTEVQRWFWLIVGSSYGSDIDEHGVDDTTWWEYTGHRPRASL